MSDRLRAAAEAVVGTYAAYRRMGVRPAPAEYFDVVVAIDQLRAALEPEHAEWCSLRNPEYTGECDCDALTEPQREPLTDDGEVTVCEIGDYAPLDSREMACVIFDGKKFAECYTNEDALVVGFSLRLLTQRKPLTDEEILRLFDLYLEARRYDGRQIHAQTGTVGYDECEWTAFQSAVVQTERAHGIVGSDE